VFLIERRSTQRVKYASFLANLALKTETNSSSCFEDEKHQEDQAAMNVGGLSLISLNLGRDIFRFSVKSGLRPG